MEALLRREKDLHTKLAAAGADYQTAADINAQLQAVAVEKDEAETGWLEAAEALEGA
jgi:ATP-binding cassette subfamily F protein uup